MLKNNSAFVLGFQNRKLLTAMIEVIARPQKYFQYHNQTRDRLPASFVNLLEDKVLNFLRP